MSKPKPKRRPRSAAKSKVHTITLTLPLKDSHLAALKKMARNRVRLMEAYRSLEPHHRAAAREQVRLLRKYLDRLHAVLVRNNRLLKAELRRVRKIRVSYARKSRPARSATGKHRTAR